MVNEVHAERRVCCPKHCRKKNKIGGVFFHLYAFNILLIAWMSFFICFFKAVSPENFLNGRKYLYKYKSVFFPYKFPEKFMRCASIFGKPLLSIGPITMP